MSCRLPSRRRRRALVFISLLLGGFFALPTLPGQNNVDFEKRLKAIREQVEAMKTKIAEEERREVTILSSLYRIVLRKNLVRNELRLYNAQRDKTEAELAALRRKIPALRERLDKEKNSMERTLVTLYKFGRFSYLQFFFQTGDVKEMVAENKHFSLLVRHQQESIRNYKKTLEELAASQAELEQKRKDIARLQSEAAVKRRELDEQEKQNNQLVARIRQNKETYQQALEELRERAVQLEQLMVRIERQEIVLPSPFIPIYERKGKLPWPLEGMIVTRFGLERHPQFRTTTQNNGIEIAPLKTDDTIKALHAGRVVYAEYFQGYGNLLIIDHGLSYYSLYGHCSEFLVEKGDLVNDGQPIAVVGDVGSLKGLTLYLEIRHKTTPLNPLQWLSRR